MEVPRLQNLWSTFAGHGIQVVAVHVSGTEADAQAWMTGLGVTFPAVQDDPSYTIMNSYTEGDGSIPHNYVIGRDLVIRKDVLGAVAEDILEGHVMDVVYLRDPVDVEMVMDVSDSMNSPSPGDPGGDSKLTMMKQAATMITDFLHDHGQADDRMGLIWFTDDVTEHQNLAGERLLPVQTSWADLRGQINVHGTGVCTAMGAGLQTAFDTLGPSVQERFAILCTDGMQNIEPKVTQVGAHYEIRDSGGWLCGGHSSVPEHPGVDITTYDTTIHTIGIGISATYEPLLQEIANETNGFYRATNDPENDLDLIYFLDLCNCLAGGSPAVVHHNAGRLYAEECEAEEHFHLNRSARKMSVMLSWRRAQGSDLSFWLHAPDGTLLSLQEEMKRFETHALATIYLPRQQDGEEIAHVGQWCMVIRGETRDPYADYHAFVIAEDRETRYHLDYPRKEYEVGDVLPIRVSLTELEEPILKVEDIVVETAVPRVPLGEVFAQFRVSPYELGQRMGMVSKESHKDPMALKMEAMAAEPRFRTLLTPIRDRLSLREGSLESKIGEKEILIPVALEKQGLHSFKVRVECQTEQNGPLARTGLLSVCVLPGKADPKQTGVTVTEITAKGRAGALMRVTPRNEADQLLGPGFGHEVKALVGKRALEIEIEDQLDGTYQMELFHPAKPKLKKGEKRAPVNVTFQGRSVWKGAIPE